MTESANGTAVPVGIKERNYGIDILRIVSMLMVTVLHFSDFSGFKGTPENGAIFYILSAFSILCYGAVDIFALISGFVMYGTKMKYSRIISLWIQVFLYSVALSAVEVVFFDGTYDMLIGYLMPVLKVRFWYFSAYFFMFFFIPFFNGIVENLPFKKMFSALAVGFIIFCICSNVGKMFAQEVIGLLKGYSTLWLSYCYLFGAFIKKNYGVFSKISGKALLLLIAGCHVLTYIGYMVPYNWEMPAFLWRPIREYLLEYTSPTVFFSSVCMLILFGKIRIKHGKKLIKILSATSFAVYIIQTHSLIWEKFILNYSTFFNFSSALGKAVAVIVGSIVFYILASLVDFLRIWIFKLLHIDSLSGFICKIAERAARTVKTKIGERFQKCIEK